MQTPARPELARTFLALVILTLLIIGSLWTLLPFIGALVWATTVVIATWPLMLQVERWTGGRRGLATAVMTIVMLAIFIIPFAMAAGTLFEGAVQGAEWARGAAQHGIGPPPAWVSTIPWLGGKIAAEWQELSAGGAEAIT